MEDVDVVTEVVAIGKVALLAPDAILTLAGTVAAVGLLLERLTTAPPDGAAALSVTVPCDRLPPTTLAGATAREDSVGVEFMIARTLISAAEV